MVVTLLADATRYNRIMDATTARLTAFATYAGAVLGKTAIQLASNYERAGIAFEVMTGSAEKGQQILKDVAKLALETPFSSDELIKSAKQVKAFGFETNDIIPILSRLGDVSSGTGADMDRIILAFGQVRTTGRLMGQELRQFTNAGVPILENLAKVMGVSVAQVPNLVRQGKVGFSDVAAAFNLMTNEGGIFHNMMQRINKETLSGRWENFKETLAQSARWLGEAASEGLNLKENLTALSAMIGGVDKGKAKKFFQDLRKGLEIVSFFVDKVWKNLKELWNSIKEGGEGLREWFAANKELTKIIAQIVAAVLIVKAFVLAWAGLKLVAVFLATIIQGFAFLLTLLNPVTIAVLGIVAALEAMGAFEGIGEILGKGLSEIGNVFKQSWKGITDAIAGGDFELAWQIALKGLRIGWEVTLIMMEAAWVRFTGNLAKKFSASGDVLSGIRLMVNDAQFWAQRQVLMPDELGAHAERHKNINDAILGKNLEFTQQHQAKTDAAVQLVMDQIKNIPQVKELESLNIKAELTRFVSKDLAGMMDVIGKSAVGKVFDVPGGGTTTRFSTSHDLLRGQAPGLVSAFPDSFFGEVAAEYFGRINQQMFAEVALAVGRVNHMLHERREGLVPWNDADIQAAANKAKELQDKFRVFREQFTKTAAEMVKDISAPRTIRPEVLTFARDLQKEFTKGVGPLEQYTHSLELLNEAYQGPLAQLGLPGRNIGAVLKTAGIFNPGVGAMANDQLFQGIVNGKENDFRLFQAFEKLRGATKMDRQGGAGAAQLFGSREAQETINRSNAQMITVEQQVLQTLRDANFLHQQSVIYQKQVVDAVKRTNEGQAAPMTIPGT